MRPYSRYKASILILLFSLSSHSLAKDYIVEMVFFADTRGVSSNYVHVSTQPVNPDLGDAILLSSGATSSGFIPYPQETFRLKNKAAALSKSGRYQVLKHIAWLQPGLAKEEAIAVRIHAGKDYRNEFKERSFAQADFSDRKLSANQPVNELDGTIKVVLGRYLHVYTDLAYRRPFNLSAASTENPLGRDRVLADFAIKTHRKMRSKTLHYIDHPLLGILVEIRPADS
jgi:hypothetical protein